MKFCVFGVALVLAGPAPALAQSAAPTPETVYSLYVARHEATVRFAEIGKTRASDGKVKQFADLLSNEHRTTAEKIRKQAEKDHVTITPVEHDTTESLLSRAHELETRSGASFDTAYALLTYEWLSTLMMDNGKRVLKPLPDGNLRKFGEAYGTFIFHELVEASKLRDKYGKKK